MQIIHRIPCRLYHALFRAALPMLPYREPTPLASLADVAPLCRAQGVSSALLVMSRSVRASGVTRDMEDALREGGIACAVYTGTRPNPTIANVEEGLALYHASHAQAIIAIGGGSVMDCAKIIGARVARPKTPVQKMKGLMRVMRRTPLLIAAPTTAGSGSETTLAAVITDEATHHKYPVSDFALIPDYAVLDAALTRTLPPHLTAATAMDALTHAVEAYIGRATTAHTREMAEEAVCLIARHLLPAFRDGQNAPARAGMMRAAYCAGVAFTQSCVGYVHALAHALGGQYGVAHGLANAILLPHLLDAYGASCHQALARLARKTGLSAAAADEEAAAAFIAWVRSMNDAMGIPETVAELKEGDIPMLARYAASEANPTYPVPLLMDAGELEGIYRRLLAHR